MTHRSTHNIAHIGKSSNAGKRYSYRLRVGVISPINRITKKITKFAIKIMLSNGHSPIIQFPYRPDVIACQPDVIYLFNSINHEICHFLSFLVLKQSFSINLPFTFVFYRFLSDFYQIFIVYCRISIFFFFF